MSRNEDSVGAVLVLTTTADDAAAGALSRTLVEEGLAACVTRTAVKSVFRWEAAAQGEPAQAGRKMQVCEEAEVLLVIKTSRRRAAEVEKRLLELHPYECPEVVRIAPEHVEEKYLAWLVASCD